MNICITGASRGLGRALTEQLLGAGHTVWGAARDEGALIELKQAHPNSFFYTKVDIVDPVDLKRWNDAMSVAGFLPECAVLNASIQKDDMDQRFSAENGQAVIDVNLSGTLRCVELFVERFTKQKNSRIIAIASTAAFRPSTHSASYSATKAAIAMAFRSFRLHFSQNIRFKTVYLGPIETEMWEGKKRWFIPSPEAASKAIARFIFSEKKVLYYPRLSTWFLRLTSCLSDRMFVRLSTLFTR